MTCRIVPKKKKSSVLSLVFFSVSQFILICYAILYHPPLSKGFIFHVATRNISFFFFFWLEKKSICIFARDKISKRIYCQNAKKFSVFKPETKKKKKIRFTLILGVCENRCRMKRRKMSIFVSLFTLNYWPPEASWSSEKTVKPNQQHLVFS